MCTACFVHTSWVVEAALGQARGISSFERVAATARLLGIRVFDLEASIVEPVVIIHDRASQIFGTKIIDKYGLTEKLQRKIVVALFVEHHAVLQAAATALLNEKPQRFSGVFGFLRPDDSYLFGGVLGDGQQ